jgi:anti-anti-sigma regulatory factor
MVGLLITFAIVIFCTVLGTLVAVRAWDFFPSRLFVLSVVALVLTNITTSTRTQITDPAIGYFFAGLSALLLSLLTIALLLLFSAMFVPQWWQGPRPIFWITLPYVVIMLLLLGDIIARTGWFVDGVVWKDVSYRFQTVQPNVRVILTLFTIGWMVHVILLATTAITRPRMRVTATLLGISLLVTIIINTIVSSAIFVQGFTNIMATVPIMSAMAYAVLNTRLLTPTRAGIDQAVAAMDEALVIVDMNGKVIYVNTAAGRVGFRQHHPLPELLRTPTEETPHDAAPGRRKPLLHTHTLTLAGRRLILHSTPVTDRSGTQIATVLLGRDVTEIEQRTEQLALERERLTTTVQQLEAEKRERLQLAATVRAMSLPVIPILDGVLVLPLIGEFDAERIGTFTTVLLTNIEREHARLVLIDITGLPLLDQAGAAGLLQGVHAARLLGARCVLVGMRPDIAESLITLGISLESLTTAATLQQALHPLMHTHHLHRS